ncbi:type II secretion system F family protein [Cohnella zeiphila]|uniref:Type II secretion system F family protein n=1 Tax=Cohnella zeiphila TaxID=2761120 RepID=A0A7X0SJ79_9BACL|nr:type II secretion system F family protein [Cohnella zeiphila]MBB6730967.1 type II secretion system F family protein [Cohnella zeiphila]
MPDYRICRLTRFQQSAAFLIGACFCFAAVWVLYRQPIVALLAVPGGYFAPGLLRRRWQRQRQERLRRSFKDMLQALGSLLAAGRSVENAFAALEDDLELLIGDPKADILVEIRAVVNRCRNGEPLEVPLADFAERSGLEEARSFSEVISICKRAGGDLVEVVRRTAGMIGEKMEVELELMVLLAQKRLESRLMMAMPFAFVGLLGFFAGDYMDGLHQGIGWLILTVCLALLGLCCWWILRIMDIRL